MTMPMAASSAMMAEMVSAGVSPGTAIMSSPTEQTAVMASSLSSVSVPAADGVDHAGVLARPGIKAPDSPPTVGGGHHAAFFDGVVEHGQRGGGAVGAAAAPGRSPQECARPSRRRPGWGPARGRQCQRARPAVATPSVPTSWPTRVILKAVFLMSSATAIRSQSFAALLQHRAHDAGAGDAHIDRRSPARRRRGRRPP